MRLGMKWQYEHIDFKKPIKLWSSGGEWMPCTLICLVGNHALCKVRYPIGKVGYKALDLDWYTNGRHKQLRNVKGKEEFGKFRLFKIKTASYFANLV